MNQPMKRVVSILLVFVMCISLLPISVLAGNADPTDTTLQSEPETPTEGICTDQEPQPDKGIDREEPSGDSEGNNPGNPLDEVNGRPSAEAPDGMRSETEITISILQQPADAEILNGIAAFTVLAECNTDDKLQYQWQVLDLRAACADNIAREAAWVNIEGANENTLYVECPDMEPASASYRCRLSCGSVSINTTEAGILTPAGSDPSVKSPEEDSPENNCGADASRETDTNGVRSVSSGPTLTLNNVIYAVSETEAAVIGHTDGISGAVSVPETINGVPVTEIADNAFEWATNLTEISMPDTVTSIGSNAFHCCWELEKVSLSGTLETIGDFAFFSCEKLCEISPLPSTLKSVGLGFLQGNHLLTLAVSPDNPYFTGKNGVLFSKDLSELIQYPCAKTGGYVVSNETKQIRNYAFCGSSVTDITLPDGIRIGEYAFSSCKALSSVVIPPKADMGHHAFSNCALEQVTISEGVETLPDYAFSECSSLREISFPASLGYIGEKAFASCNYLSTLRFSHDRDDRISWYDPLPESSEEVTIFVPDTYTGEINSNIQSFVSNLTVLEYRPIYSYYRIDYHLDGGTNDANAPRKYPVSGSADLPDPTKAGCRFDGWFDNPEFSGKSIHTLSNGVTAVYAKWVNLDALTDDTGLCGDHLTWIYEKTSSTLSITGYGEMYDYAAAKAPWYCYHDKIKAINLFDGITAIGNYAFDGCSQVPSINIPYGVEKIGSYAFHSCNSLKSLSIPQSVSSIGSYAFYNCNRMAALSLPSGLTAIPEGMVSQCSALTAVNLPDSVTGIGDRAFMGCPLSGIRLPSALTSIGAEAFSQCKLSNITIPYGVTSLGKSVFMGCPLTSVSIPESVVSIDEKAFSQCSDLKTVFFPGSVTSIGEDCFYQCSKLEQVEFGGSAPAISANAFRNAKRIFILFLCSDPSWDTVKCKNYGGELIWVQPYSIEYILDGGTYSGENPQTYLPNETVRLSKPTRIGYTFGGWFTDDALSVLCSEIPQGTEGNITLYAKWIPNTITVKYVGNGATGGTTVTRKKPADDETPVAINHTFRRNGYHFSGWNTKADGSGYCVDGNDGISVLLPFVINNAVTLYAQWVPNEYTIAFDANGGTGAMDPIAAVYGAAQSLPMNRFIKTGYVFCGWKLAAKVYADGQSVNNLSAADGDVVTLVAQWKADTTYEGYNYRIVFDGNGNTGGKMAPQAMKVGTAKALTANGFTKAGYHAAGWALSENGDAVFSNKETVKDIHIPLQQNPITLYAVWKPNCYTVTFDGNGGKASDGKSTTFRQILTYDAKEALAPSVFSRKGYTFLGWSTSPKAAEVTYREGQEGIFNLTGNQNAEVTLYAVWKPNTYNIVYLSHHGTGSAEPQTAVYGKSIKLNPNAYTFPGFSFTFWSTPDGKVFSDKAMVINLCTGEDEDHRTIVLTANWSPNTYTVKFNANGAKGNLPANAAGSGNTPIEIPDSCMAFEGFTFREWNTKPDGTGTGYLPGQGNVVLDTKDRETVILYAIWNYAVTFHPGTGTGSPFTDPEMVYNRISAMAPDPFCKTGHYLAGWNKSESAAARGSVQYKATGLKNVGANATLYAVWKPCTYSVCFDANGGTGKMSNLSMTYGTAKALAANAFKNPGHTFLGWSTTLDGTVEFTNRQSIKEALVPSVNNQVITLYAVWSE